MDARGDLYAAAAALDLESDDPALRGVYRVERDGTTVRLPGTEAMQFPNDVTLGPGGTVCTTER